jgi:hypothetical protein
MQRQPAVPFIIRDVLINPSIALTRLRRAIIHDFLAKPPLNIISGAGMGGADKNLRRRTKLN